MAMQQTRGLTEAPAPRSYSARIQTVRSAGGLEAWLVEDHTIPMVAMSLGWAGGATQDPLGRPGGAALLSASLDEGAGDLDSDAFQQALQDDAISLSFTAERDVMRGRVVTLADNIGRAFELLTLAIREPRFDPNVLHRLRGQLVSMLNRETTDPEKLAARRFRELAFPGHPYGQSVLGEADVMPLIDRREIVDLHARAFARDNLKIAVVGAIRAADLSVYLDDAFGALPVRSSLVPTRDIVMSGLGTRQTESLDVPQSTIHFGRPGIARNDPDFFKAVLVNHCVGGGGMTSRLFKEAREKKGLCYGISTQNATFDHTAFFVGAMATRNDRVDESIETIRAELDRVIADGFEQEEIESAKRYLIGSYALGFDTSRKIAGQLANVQLQGHDVEWLDLYPEQIATMTCADASRVARRLLGDGSLLVAICGRPS